MNNNIVPMNGGDTVVVDPMQTLLNKIDSKQKDIVNKLDAKIPRDVIAKREGGNGRTLDYLEGWYVIARMNEIFGQGGWMYTTDEMRLVHQGEVPTKYGTNQVAHYIAKVTVRAMGVQFTDYGYGDGSDKVNPGKAHELAAKEAVTDGIKRAAKNFGMSMGLALYDKSQENVDEQTEVEPASRAGNTKRANAIKSEGSESVATVTNTTAPKSSEPNTSQGTGKETLAGKAKNRDELNALISAAARAAVSKKLFTDMSAIKTHMKTTFSTDKKEELTDAQATEFLNFLDNTINKGAN